MAAYTVQKQLKGFSFSDFLALNNKYGVLKADLTKLNQANSSKSLLMKYNELATVQKEALKR